MPPYNTLQEKNGSIQHKLRNNDTCCQYINNIIIIYTIYIYIYIYIIHLSIYYIQYSNIKQAYSYSVDFDVYLSLYSNAFR